MIFNTWTGIDYFLDLEWTDGTVVLFLCTRAPA